MPSLQRGLRVRGRSLFRKRTLVAVRASRGIICGARPRPGRKEGRVEAASCLEHYLARPVGRYFVGPTYVVWWQSVRLNGISLWGRPEEDHIVRITRALEAELEPGVSPHASLIDLRRVW